MACFTITLLFYLASQGMLACFLSYSSILIHTMVVSFRRAPRRNLAPVCLNKLYLYSLATRAPSRDMFGDQGLTFTLHWCFISPNSKVSSIHVLCCYFKYILYVGFVVNPLSFWCVPGTSYVLLFCLLLFREGSQ